MSIASLITMGIGPDGSIPFLLTGGLGNYGGVTPTVTVEEFRKHGAGRPERLYSPPHRVAKRDKDDLRKVYEQAREVIPEKLQAGLAPVRYQTEAHTVSVMPPVSAIDFARFSEDLRAVQVLIAAYEAALDARERLRRRRADEERFILTIAEHV